MSKGNNSIRCPLKTSNVHVFTDILPKTWRLLLSTAPIERHVHPLSEKAKVLSSAVCNVTNTSLEPFLSQNGRRCETDAQYLNNWSGYQLVLSAR